MGPSATNPVKSIEAMFTIVEALKQLDGAGVTELADHLELPKSTIHNYLATLEQEEYVVKEGTTYRVGLRFLDLGAYARDQVEMFEVAKPELEHLASETGELANLLVEEEHGRVVPLPHARRDGRPGQGHVGTRARSTAPDSAKLSSRTFRGARRVHRRPPRHAGLDARDHHRPRRAVRRTRADS